MRALMSLLLVVLLLSPTACAAPGTGNHGPPAVSAAHVDQLLGVYLAWDLGPKTPDETAAAVGKALAVFGLQTSDLGTVLEDTPFTASGLLVATKVVEAHPDLAPWRDTIAKLWALALYRDGATLQPVAAPPDPGGAPPSSPMTSLGTGPRRCGSGRRRRRRGYGEHEGLAAGPGPEERDRGAA